MVLPLNPDTWFCRLIPTHGFAGVTDKEYKCHGHRNGTPFLARNAHATSYSLARASGDCPTGRTRSKRRLDCTFLGPRLSQRASAVAASPHSRQQRPPHFLPKPGLPAPAPVPRPGRGGLTVASRAPNLGRWLGARVVASGLSCGTYSGGTHAATVVPACGADTGAQRSPLGAQFLPARATAPRSLANGRCRPSPFAEWHTGLLAAHRG